MIVVGIFFFILGLLYILIPGKMFKANHLGSEPSESAKFFYVLRGIMLAGVGLAIIIADIYRMTS